MVIKTERDRLIFEYTLSMILEEGQEKRIRTPRKPCTMVDDSVEWRVLTLEPVLIHRSQA